MIRVSVFFPKTNESRFDMDYFLTKHVPMVRARLAATGLVNIEADQGLQGATPDQPAAYAVIAHMLFSAVEDFQRSMDHHGTEIVGDIQNFSNVPPQLQVSSVISTA